MLPLKQSQEVQVYKCVKGWLLGVLLSNLTHSLYSSTFQHMKFGSSCNVPASLLFSLLNLWVLFFLLSDPILHFSNVTILVHFHELFSKD